MGRASDYVEPMIKNLQKCFGITYKVISLYIIIHNKYHNNAIAWPLLRENKQFLDLIFNIAENKQNPRFFIKLCNFQGNKTQPICRCFL